LPAKRGKNIVREAPLPLTKEQHLDPNAGPKRILALDGGGIRGILTLQFLQVIETLIKKRFGEKTLLCDYFDLIGGTSTGSIIAAGLACGMTVGALQDLYKNIGDKVFQQGGFSRFLPESLQGKLAPKFPFEPLQAELDRQLGADTTLDSAKILTGLMIMAKRLDTGSPWPLNNGGRGKFAAQDGALLLTHIVRASTAAPTYFAPQEIPIHSRNGTVVDGAFVDGGVTPFNDPALQLLMLAGLQGHGFCWPTGKDKLLIVSVGTGQYREPRSAQAVVSDPAALQGIVALQSLMDDCERMNRATLQWLTNCLTPWIIDRVVGDMKLDSEKGPQLATYVRYNVLFEEKWLSDKLKVERTPEQLAQIAQMDKPANMKDLADLGRIAANVQVQADHFPAAFDLKA
jgi:predicted patatin/cPLA2 family phospholipase